MKTTIQLGDKVKDTISGFTGIVIARTEWLNGCERITIQSQELKDGKPIDAHTFDQEQIEVLKSKQKPQQKAPTGGPHDPPARNADPKR